MKIKGYLMTQRPPSIGTHPSGAISIEEIYFKNRNSYLLQYDRDLTIEEMRKYEILPYIEFKGKIKYSKFIFDVLLSERGYVILENEKAFFSESYLDFYENVKKGLYQLIDDNDLSDKIN